MQNIKRSSRLIDCCVSIGSCANCVTDSLRGHQEQIALLQAQTFELDQVVLFIGERSDTQQSMMIVHRRLLTLCRAIHFTASVRTRHCAGIRLWKLVDINESFVVHQLLLKRANEAHAVTARSSDGLISARRRILNRKQWRLFPQQIADFKRFRCEHSASVLWTQMLHYDVSFATRNELLIILGFVFVHICLLVQSNSVCMCVFLVPGSNCVQLILRL
jgi:hypothetical protein